jgi:hypothetical protein
MILSGNKNLPVYNAKQAEDCSSACLQNLVAMIYLIKVKEPPTSTGTWVVVVPVTINT